jgi:hypothetical protein
MAASVEKSACLQSSVIPGLHSENKAVSVDGKSKKN